MKYRFPKKIKDYIRYDKVPNDISSGHLYTKEITLPYPNESKRIVRIYLPSDYDGKKKHKLLFMCDGQNIVDAYTSAYGEWDIDDHDEWLIQNGYPSIVVVGIDCPKNPFFRTMEYVINNVPANKHFEDDVPKDVEVRRYGKTYLDYVVNELLPDIRKTFSVSVERKDTAYGGSSMGGLFAFDAVNTYPDIFSFSLAFSPAFCIHRKRPLKRYVKNYYKNQGQYIYLLSGKIGFEKMFTRPTKRMYKQLIKQGFENNVMLNIDKKGEHNEATWSKHFLSAILFWYSKE